MRRALVAFGAGALALGALTVPSTSASAATLVPSVTVTVLCVRRTSFTDYVWFGWTNQTDVRVAIPVGVRNSVSNGGGGFLQNQPSQFRPARSAGYSFVATVAHNQSVGWLLNVPVWDRDSHTFKLDAAHQPVFTNVTATSSATTPNCPSGTARRSVTVRGTGTEAEGSIGWVPGPQTRTNGVLTRSTVDLTLNGVASVCSTGGTPLAPKVLWGYADARIVEGVMLLGGPGRNYRPLPTSDVVRTDTFNAVSGGDPLAFARSWRGRRVVDDPQRITVFGSTPAEQMRNPQPRGYSGMNVIADVWGRCQFGTTSVQSVQSIAIDGFGPGTDIHSVTDQATQTPRTIVVCPINPPPGPILGCDVPGNGIITGGGKLRR